MQLMDQTKTTMTQHLREKNEKGPKNLNGPVMTLTEAATFESSFAGLPVRLFLGHPVGCRGPRRLRFSRAGGVATPRGSASGNGRGRGRCQPTFAVQPVQVEAGVAVGQHGLDVGRRGAAGGGGRNR
jgi:hypothetical protein